MGFNSGFKGLNAAVKEELSIIILYSDLLVLTLLVLTLLAIRELVFGQ